MIWVLLEYLIVVGIMAMCAAIAWTDCEMRLEKRRKNNGHK